MPSTKLKNKKTKTKQKQKQSKTKTKQNKKTKQTKTKQTKNKTKTKTMHDSNTAMKIHNFVVILKILHQINRPAISSRYLFGVAGLNIDVLWHHTMEKCMTLPQ